MKPLKNVLLTVIFSCIFTACQKAQEQQLWEETTTTLEKSKVELEEANQLSKELIKLINAYENDPRRTTYLALLRDLKELENSLMQFEDDLQPLDSMRLHYSHDSIINYLRAEQAWADSLTQNLAATVKRSKSLLPEAGQ